MGIRTIPQRAGFTDYVNNAVDRNEAHTMLDAGEILREALENVGQAPR